MSQQPWLKDDAAFGPSVHGQGRRSLWDRVPIFGAEEIITMS